MKKWMRFGLLLGIIFCFMIGCGKKEETQALKEVKLLFSVSDLSDNFISNIAEQAEQYAEKNKIELTIVNAKNEIESQSEQIKNAKSQGYTAIICNPIDTDTSLQLIDAAEGLPIVFVNRSPDENLLKKEKYIYVGSDETISAKFQAEYLAAYFKDKTSVKAVLFRGEKGQAACETRTESVKDELKKLGIQVEYVFDDYADWSREKAKEAFLIFLDQEREFDCIISNNDEMALGVIEAMKQSKISPCDYPIVGIDATADGCEAVLNGDMAFTVRQSAAGQGKYCVLAAEKLSKGESLSDVEYISENECIIWIPFEKVDAESLK